MKSKSIVRSPYVGLPARQFWARRSGDTAAPRTAGLYRKKFPIDRSMNIMTAGSCFAQNIAQRLVKRGYSVIDEEPSPSNLGGATARNFGYNLYSARYGNIYTARHLLQLLRSTVNRFEPQDIVWQKGDRFYDALRPSVEPNGLASPEEVLAHREEHLARVRKVVQKADLMVFTFGLTRGVDSQKAAVRSFRRLPARSRAPSTTNSIVF